MKKWAWLLSSLLIISIGSGCSITRAEKVVATVNGEKITSDEYDFYLQSVKSEMESEAGSENLDKFWDTEIEGKKAVDKAKEKALEEAVKNKVQLQKAKEMGITLDDKDRQDVAKQKKGYMDSWGGKDSYNQKLKEIGLTDESLTNLLQNQAIIQKLYQKITSDPQQFNISDQDMQSYYDSHKDDFKKVKAKHILFSTVDENRQPLPQDKQDEAKKKADDIYAKVKAGEDFDTLMKQYSEDPGLQQSPDGYTFGKGEMVKEFEDAAFALKPGEVSNIVKSDFGYHIIKCVENPIYQTFDEVKDKIKSDMEKEKYDAMVDQWRKGATIKTDEKVLQQIKVK